MNKYILKGTGTIIETTEERYKKQFKDIGYVPFTEEKEPKKIEVKKTSKK